jgi:hypothetical protein
MVPLSGLCLFFDLNAQPLVADPESACRSGDIYPFFVFKRLSAKRLDFTGSAGAD